LVGRVSAYNSLQNTGLSTSLAARVTSGTLGTVPAGKIWRVTQMTGVQDALGADATAAIGILKGATFIPLTEFVAIAVGANAVSFQGQLILVAGDDIVNRGDAGATNHTWDMTATFQEFDA